jgi:cytochrome b6-f complex iron-sulfur subunit
MNIGLDMDSNSTTRRSVLDVLLGLGSIASVVGAISPVLAYLSPLAKQVSSGNTLEDKNGIPVSAESLTEGSGLVGRLGGLPVLAIRKNGQILGYSAVCTHLGCVVRWSPDKDRIECPCHGGQFNLLGAVVSGPPPEGIQPITLRVEGNRILRG